MLSIIYGGNLSKAPKYIDKNLSKKMLKTDLKEFKSYVKKFYKINNQK